MKCQEAKFLISLYIDGELEEDQKIALFQHLSSCSECQEELHEANYLNKLMRNYCYEEDPPSNFSQQVMKKVENTKAPERDFRADKKDSPRFSPLFYRFLTVGVATFCFIFLSASTIFSNPGGNNFLKVSMEEEVSAPAEEQGTPLNFLQKILPGGSENKIEDSNQNDLIVPEETDIVEDGTDRTGKEESTLAFAEEDKVEKAAGKDTDPANTSGGNKVENEQIKNNKGVNENNSSAENEVNAPSPAENGGKVTIAGEPMENNLFSFKVLEQDPLAIAPYFKDKNTLLYLRPSGKQYVLVELKLSSNTKKEITNINMNPEEGFSWQNNILSYVTPDGAIAYWGKEAKTIYGFAPLLSGKGYLSYITSGEYKDKLYVITDNEAELVDEGDFTAGAWSPDGSKLTYLKKEGDRIKLGFYNGINKKQTSVTSFIASDGSLAWLPSSNEIVVAVTGNESGIWLVNLNDGKKECLVTVGGKGLISVSALGEKIAFEDEKGRLMLLNFKGRSYITLHQIAQGGAFTGLSWSIDESSLVYSQAGKGITLVKLK